MVRLRIKGHRRRLRLNCMYPAFWGCFLTSAPLVNLEDSFCLGGGPRTQKNVIGKLRLHLGKRSFPGFCSYIEVPEDLCLRARDAHHLVVEANTVGAAGSVHGKGAVEVVDDHMK